MTNARRGCRSAIRAATRGATRSIARASALTLSVAFVAASTSVLSAVDPAAPLDDDCWSESFVEEWNELDLVDPETGKGRWKPAYIWGSEVVINEELQYYLDPGVFRANPFSVKDGVLAIEARPTPHRLSDKVLDQPYVSGVLTTETSFSQRHGRFEIVAKPPAGSGLWAAFWLLPSFDRWPKGVAILPEIDVMEFLGDAPNTFHTTLHTNQTGKLTSHPYDHTVKTPLSDDFHRYSVVWTPEQVHWYLDRQRVASHPTPDDFTRPVHFLLNLAVGGTWPGPPDDSTVFPARYLIDSVRAWRDNGEC